MSPHARETRPFATEIKFVVDAATGARIREWVRENLEPDPYGGGPFKDEYQTASLYFDTSRGDVFHQRGSFGRSKYRVRRYGAASFVFLERKLRKPGILVKRRTTVALEAIDRLALSRSDPEWPGDGFTAGCCCARSRRSASCRIRGPRASRVRPRAPSG